MPPVGRHYRTFNRDRFNVVLSQKPSDLKLIKQHHPALPLMYQAKTTLKRKTQPINNVTFIINDYDRALFTWVNPRIECHYSTRTFAAFHQPDLPDSGWRTR
jgi:hypothetical protein